MAPPRAPTTGGNPASHRPYVPTMRLPPAFRSLALLLTGAPLLLVPATAALAGGDPVGLARSVLAELAEHVAASGSGGPAAADAPIARREGGAAPLSPAQERLWFLHQLDPRSAAYHLAFALRLAAAAETLHRLDAVHLEVHRPCAVDRKSVV